jgi:hypothetical protein
MSLPHPLQQLLVARVFHGREPAGDENQVGRRCLGERVRRHDDKDTGIGGDEPRFVPDEPDLGVG